MTRLANCLGAACIFLVSHPAFAQIGTPEPSQTTAIDVLVTDSDGRPIGDAEVSWSPAGPELRRGRRVRAQTVTERTDSNGKCSIEFSGEGSFRMTVKREGYLDADDESQLEHVEIVDVPPGRSIKRFVDLVHGGTFQGTVYLDDGRPLPGAIVRLQAATLSWNGSVQGAAPKWLVTKTDAQGNYGFPLVPPSRYGMWIAPPDEIVKESLEQNDREEWTGYPTATWHSSVEELRRIIPVEIAPGEDVQGYNVVLRKTRVYPFQGVLREWSGKPLTRAKVAIRVGTTEPVTLLEPRPVDAATGEFDFPALPDGRCWLLVYRDDAPGSPPYAVPLEPEQRTREQQASRRMVRVPPWAPVAGKVRIVAPVPAVAEQTGQTAAGTPAQPVPLPSRPWTPPAPVRVWLTPGAFAVPVRGDTISAESSDSSDSGTMNFPAIMLAPDAYEFQVQAPESWYIASARSGDSNLLQTRIVQLTPGRYDRPVEFVVEIRPGGAAIEGVVVNEKGERLSGSAICAVAEATARRLQPGGAFCVRADGDGAFRSQWMSPGDWRVWALTKKPHDSPATPEFLEKYKRQARQFTVPEHGMIFRQTLVAIE